MESSTEIIIKLSMKEALWLKALMQNPIYNSPDEESPENKSMRENFWNILKHVKH